MCVCVCTCVDGDTKREYRWKELVRASNCIAIPRRGRSAQRVLPIQTSHRGEVDLKAVLFPGARAVGVHRRCLGWQRSIVIDRTSCNGPCRLLPPFVCDVRASMYVCARACVKGVRLRSFLDAIGCRRSSMHAGGYLSPFGDMAPL